MITHPDTLHRKLLGLLEAGFPLTCRPFYDLGQALGIDEDAVLGRVGRMKQEGMLRQIGPVLEARRLGYRSTLVAIKVPEDGPGRAGRTTAIIAGHPGISHVYERDHHFNLWLTLAMPAAADMAAEICRLAEAVGAEQTFDLPAVRKFKLKTSFGADEEGDENESGPSRTAAPGAGCSCRLSPLDRETLNELQQDLPLVPRPFAGMSSRLGVEEEGFLARCRSLAARGIIRRYGASVNHRRAGFTANAMTCWAVPAENVPDIAGKLVPLKAVSHCYERMTGPLWRHNVFAMIHGHSREECQEIAAEVSAQTGLTDRLLLFSTREIKKTRVIYRV